MLLKYIRMVNFRQYYGDNTVEFSCDLDKNVTIILGKNTSGKTTMVQAFNWGLYGQAKFKTQMLLNENIANDMKSGDKEKVIVEIGLIHNNIDYKIERIQEYQCVNRGDIRSTSQKKSMSYKKIDGQTKTIDGFEIDNSINKILPEGLSSYFFFDGERINNISKKQDVTASIKGLMGLDVLESARDHLSKCKSVFTKALDLEGNEKAISAQNNIDSQKNKLEKIKDDIDNVSAQIEYYQEVKEQAAIELRENAETSALQSKKENLQRAVIGLEGDYNNSTIDLIGKFNKNAFAYFATPMIRAALDLVRNTSYVSESIKGMHSDSINQLLSRGYCICGTKLETGSEATAHMLKERDMMPPKSIGTYVAEFSESSELYLSNSEDYHNDISQKYKDLRRYKKDISRAKAEYDQLSQSLLDKKDTRVLEENYRTASKLLKTKEDEKSNLEGRKAICENEIRNYQKIFDSLVKSSEKNNFINTCIEYTQNMYDWVNSSYLVKEEDIRSRLEYKINNIFGRMYHGKRMIKIDKNYKVYYSDVNTDESGGLETVKNFAFIAGLVDLARDRIAEKSQDEYDLGTEAYPLVMDAPFSTADEKHVSNISRILPEIAEQVIMVVMEKDWTFAQIEMEERVGKKYIINKETETKSNISEI